jgi:hypothetical protein
MENLKDFFGIVVYSIENDEDGYLLNGLWTNNKANNKIMNEIARKQHGKNQDIQGNYKLAWIEPDEKFPVCGTLKIEKTNQEETTYSFEWWEKGNNKKPNFIGKGLRIGEKQLVAFYWIAE